MRSQFHRQVYIHGILRNEEGRSSPRLLVIISIHWRLSKFGCDALRWSVLIGVRQEMILGFYQKRRGT